MNIISLSDSSGLVALAPLWVTTVGHTVDILGFIGDHGLDYLDFIVRSSHERDAALNHMMAFIMQSKSWHLLVLSELRYQSTATICGVLDQLSIPYLCRPISTCYAIPLPASYEQYLSSLGKSTRRRLLYDARRLEALYSASFSVYKEFTPEFRRILEKVHNIHQERWAAASEPGVFQSLDARQMDYSINEALYKNGMLRYFVLSVDDDPIAALSAAQLGNHLYTHIMSVSRHEEYRKWSPGMVMLSNVVEWAIGQGLRTLDLTRGSEPYKMSLGGVSSSNYRVVVPRRRVMLPLAKIAEAAGVRL